MPGIKHIDTTNIEVRNDKEKLIITFNNDGMIILQIVESLPVGKGFHGPIGFYQQIGGEL